jgi:tetratricopeptide (TPR) repeat protein
MEQVIPGADTDDFAEDPIVDAAERSATGDPDGASAILNSLLAHDLRCLDAHAHLGDLAIAAAPAHALRHYAVGAAIGALSLGESFEGVLPWALDDNRPYLRCLHGLGLCHWRLGDVDAARAVFQRMLWLNPTDEQGVRLHLEALEAAV